MVQGATATIPGSTGPRPVAGTFFNCNDLQSFRAQIEVVNAQAVKGGRTAKSAVNGFVIVIDTEEEAVRTPQEIQGKADEASVEAFEEAVKQAGASTANKTDMWANSKLQDLIQYNDEFKTKLMGNKQQVTGWLVLCKSLVVGLVLKASFNFED